MTKRNKREKDAIDGIVDQLDLNGITQDELFGEGGLVKTLTSRILTKALEAEMENHLGYRKNAVEGNTSGNCGLNDTKTVPQPPLKSNVIFFLSQPTHSKQRMVKKSSEFDMFPSFITYSVL